MLYSVSDLIYNSQMKDLPDGKLHITMENAKLFYLSMYESKIDRNLGTDLKREYQEYEALGIPKETEGKWRKDIYDEIMSLTYKDDLLFSGDYLHLFHFLDTKEKKNAYFLFISEHLLRFKVKESRLFDAFHTIYQLIADMDVELKNKKSVLESIKGKYEVLGFSENPDIGSFYTYFLKGLIPSVGLGSEELDETLYSMIPENFKYMTEVPYPSENTMYACMLGIGCKKDYLKAYDELKRLIPIVLPDKEKLDKMLSAINRRSHMDYTFDDVMKCPSETDHEEIYFSMPDTHITMDNAKRYYYFAKCSFMMVSDHFRKRTREFMDLHISHDTLEEWTLEYMKEKLKSVENDEEFFNTVMFHSSVVYEKEDTKTVFERIKKVLDKRMVSGRDFLNLLDYFELAGKPAEITGFARTLLFCGMSEELDWLLSYLKKCMKAKENKDDQFVPRLRKAMKILKTERRKRKC